MRRSGPPLAPQTEALLGWVVREAVTNVVRHSRRPRAARSPWTAPPNGSACTIADDGSGEPVASSTPPLPGIGGTGLKGLTERLAAAGGSLRAGPSPRAVSR